MESQGKIAALFVEKDGCYFDLPNIEPWDRERDARFYDGPWPVIAHPPCERWGRYWGGAPTTWPRLKKGDDGGCFASALASVRRWGGILEHPADSYAWKAFGLLRPDRPGGWIKADWMAGYDGWTCFIEQGAYGHLARKGTWLYAHGINLPLLSWGRTNGDFIKFDAYETRAEAIKKGIVQRLSKRQRAATPESFRDLLIAMVANGIPR